MKEWSSVTSTSGSSKSKTIEKVRVIEVVVVRVKKKKKVVLKVVSVVAQGEVVLKVEVIGRSSSKFSSTGPSRSSSISSCYNSGSFSSKSSIWSYKSSHRN